MKTYSPRPQDVSRRWWVLDADGLALGRLAAEVGLPADEAAETLAGDRFAAEVREDERTAARIGISAVPFFVADRAVGVAGAQPPEILGEFLRRAAERQAG
jgi:predicted DsbA family dithiol-disulfide isomerase